MRRQSKTVLVRWVLALVLAGAVAWFAWTYWPQRPARLPDANTPDANVAGGGVDANATAGRGRDANVPATRDANQPPEGDATTRKVAVSNGVVRALAKLDAAAAGAALQKGNELLAGNRLAEGRVELSRAVLSGKLPAAEEVLKTIAGG